MQVNLEMPGRPWSLAVSSNSGTVWFLIFIVDSILSYYFLLWTILWHSFIMDFEPSISIDIQTKTKSEEFLLTACSCHVRNVFQSHNHLVRKRIIKIYPNWPVWLNGWVFVYKISGCGFKSSYSQNSFYLLLLCRALLCYHLNWCQQFLEMPLKALF